TQVATCTSPQRPAGRDLRRSYGGRCLRDLEQRERPGELRVDRRTRLDTLARAWMHERQPSRVQQHPMDAQHPERAVVAAVAVTGVADQVVRGVLEVAPDLAKAAGFRAGLQQGIA